MRFCQAHWDRLREEIRAQGLDHLVSSSGEEEAARLASSINDIDKAAVNFDPLMWAYFAIWSAFIEDAGVGGLTFDGCPLCVVCEQAPELDGEWLRGAVADQRAYAAEHELLRQ